jgi:cytoskeletal protein RodZ
MALSMDEQRMLAEIERRLAAEDPRLAARLSTFRRPARVNVFRSARARVIGSLFTVAVVAMVSLVVYAIVPFRSGSRTSGHHPVTTVSTTGQAKLSAGPGKNPASSSGQASATSPSAKAKAKASASAVAAAQTPAAKAAHPGTRADPGTHAASGMSTHPAAQSATSPKSATSP